jgi:hypothetical protein
VTAPDGATLLLSIAIRLLPPARRDWARAMRAELAGIETGRDRWSFALGCAGSVLRQPIVMRSLAYSVLMVGAVAVTVVWTASVAYATVRWGVVAVVGVLIAVAWLGRVSSPLGPVGESRTARFVRGAGSVLVAVVAVGLIAEVSRSGLQLEDAEAQVPFLGAILLCYLVGFVAVTANRSAANAWTLQTGAGAGVGGALLWLGMVVVSPPIPYSIQLALYILVATMGVAALLTWRQPSSGLLAALTAGSVTTLMVLIELVLLSSYAPASMIPDLARAAVTPADDLAQSRREVQDPYVAMMVIGAVIALALGLASIALRREVDDETNNAAVIELGERPGRA